MELRSEIYERWVSVFDVLIWEWDTWTFLSFASQVLRIAKDLRKEIMAEGQGRFSSHFEVMREWRGSGKILEFGVIFHSFRDCSFRDCTLSSRLISVLWCKSLSSLESWRRFSQTLDGRLQGPLNLYFQDLWCRTFRGLWSTRMGALKSLHEVRADEKKKSEQHRVSSFSPFHPNFIFNLERLFKVYNNVFSN